MQVNQSPSFRKVYKKLHNNQKTDVNTAVRELMGNPSLGESKTGNLTGVLVYKFRMVKQETLLAYTFDAYSQVLTLMSLGSHENFYRDLKK
ncbi:type II toxin-antitoxin system RelE/ParE family toxin [Piscirickettsia litoralis]|uniref:Addiction module toxin RelE n=1 Tax=Piscirickettsia litoralis TaxID=1891921 RepID=A0ABX2ZY32_9GAMM|nr:type II toxin-antitoxin system RelE/ParE family toxin [Piscirickettsia litoralis]ODN41398.1 addiction module toxin RelE [Piscirickettsia litoralis]